MAGRRQARIAAMRAVFAGISGGETAALSLERLREAETNARARAVLNDALTTTIAQVYDLRRERIDALAAAACASPWAHMTAVERAIIAAAAAEMLSPLRTPVKAVINEAVEMAKIFGADGGAGLVNGVLDNIAKRLAAGE